MRTHSYYLYFLSVCLPTYHTYRKKYAIPVAALQSVCVDHRVSQRICFLYWNSCLLFCFRLLFFSKPSQSSGHLFGPSPCVPSHLCVIVFLFFLCCLCFSSSIGQPPRPVVFFSFDFLMLFFQFTTRRVHLHLPHLSSMFVFFIPCPASLVVTVQLFLIFIGFQFFFFSRRIVCLLTFSSWYLIVRE